MYKVKVKQVFKFKNGKQFKKDDIVELSEKEIKAVQEQLGNEFVEVIEEVKEEANFNEMNVADIKEWLKEKEVEFSDEKKPELVELANEKLAELNEQEENEKE